jgi:hypothetical protein
VKEMSETPLRNPGGVPSSEAAHVALLFANGPARFVKPVAPYSEAETGALIAQQAR